MSSGDEELSDGRMLTSSSHGLRYLSRRISNPNSSKQVFDTTLLAMHLNVTIDSILFFFWFYFYFMLWLRKLFIFFCKFVYLILLCLCFFSYYEINVFTIISSMLSCSRVMDFSDSFSFFFFFEQMKKKKNEFHIYINIK